MSETKRPPNRSAAAAAKPASAPPSRPAAQGVFDGAVKIEVTMGDVKLTIEGPILKVMAILDALFGGGGQPSSVISRLQLVFGPETPVTRKT